MREQQAMPSTFEVMELDEDWETCGVRNVRADDRVIPLGDFPRSITAIRIVGAQARTFVPDITVGWFDPEERPEYELANRSRVYLAVDLVIPNATEREYNEGWTRFREVGIPCLLKRLGMTSWGIGRGIVDRRGHDLFVVELDGLETLMWTLYSTVGRTDTYRDLWHRSATVELCAAAELMPLLRPAGAV